TETEATGAPQKHHYTLNQQVGSITGTAYAVWVGIGALGTAAYGIIYLNEDKGLLRIACFGLILAGIIGLKILAGHKQL
ncbi:DMT family transporter, partial [Klebsiella michiganensis]|uniref:DMT family transporter n=1 Tax=Klebsiella michiganensis TaxID=1134687 RepID=UPI00292C436D